MKITHKSKDAVAAGRARDAQDQSDVEEFVVAFVADHAKDPSSLTPALKAFVERYSTYKGK